MSISRNAGHPLMACYTLTEKLRLPLSSTWPDPVTLTWSNGRLSTPDAGLTLSIGMAAEAEAEVGLPLPASASPPYLSGHDQSLAWLQQHIMEPEHEAAGDLVAPDLLPEPGMRTGPVAGRRKSVQ